MQCPRLLATMPTLQPSIRAYPVDDGPSIACFVLCEGVRIDEGVQELSHLIRLGSVFCVNFRRLF